MANFRRKRSRRQARNRPHNGRWANRTGVHLPGGSRSTKVMELDLPSLRPFSCKEPAPPVTINRGPIRPVVDPEIARMFGRGPASWQQHFGIGR